MIKKEELLEKDFGSAPEAMNALNDFLCQVDNSPNDENRGDYQTLRVIGTRIYD